MNYLNPHTHDLSGDQPKGLWIARPECIVTHDPDFKNKEITDLGWRDRGPGYDHEHFDRIRIEPASPEIGEFPEFDAYEAEIVITWKVQGRPVVFRTKLEGTHDYIANMIERTGDSFRDHIER